MAQNATTETIARRMTRASMEYVPVVDAFCSGGFKPRRFWFFVLQSWICVRMSNALLWINVTLLETAVYFYSVGCDLTLYRMATVTLLSNPTRPRVTTIIHIPTWMFV